jgi:P27 family predicted phage terminase small subunit
LARDGLLIEGCKGTGQKAHPAARMLESTRAQLSALLDKFGLTPRSREGLNVKPRVRKDGQLAKYLAP